MVTAHFEWSICFCTPTHHFQRPGANMNMTTVQAAAHEHIMLYLLLYLQDPQRAAAVNMN